MASIITFHGSTSVATAMAMALRADNKNAPKPLKIRSRAGGHKVTTEINGAQDLESLIATTDDLLLCIIATEKTLSSLKLESTRQHRRVRLHSSPLPKV